MGEPGILSEDFYNLDEAYEAARTRFDPELSPHTAFRALNSGYHARAIEFLARFGPLEYQHIALKAPVLSQKLNSDVLVMQPAEN
jgi:hypothetical protein